MLKATISGFYDEASFSLDEQIALIESLNGKYMCPRRINSKTITDYTADEFIRDVKPKLDTGNIKFSSIGSSIGKVGVDDEAGYNKQIEKLKELTKIAQLMQCKYIRIFSFIIPRGDDPFKHRDVVMRKLQGFLDVVKGTDIILLHENEKEIYGDVAMRCLDIYKTLNNPQLQLIYDSSNFIQCNEDPIAAFDMLKDYVVYYHIKDCDKSSKVEMPVGTGDSNYKHIIGELAARNYEGFFTIEPHTVKYALLRKMIYFTPARFARYDVYKTFRRTDKALGYGMFKKVSRKDVVVLQYKLLEKLISEENK